MKKFNFYDDNEAQFIDAGMKEKLDGIRSNIVEGMIGLRKVNEFSPKRTVLFMYMRDPIHTDASVYELAAGFYDRIFRKNIWKAMSQARNLVHSVNHWKENKCVRIHIINGKYKSIPSEVAYEPTEAILNAVSDGSQKTKREDKQILRMPIKTRRKMAQKLETEEFMKAENRKASAERRKRNSR